MNYKTLFTIVLMALALVMNVSAVQTACHNQDDKPYCLPGDSTCTLHTDGSPEAEDADGDGWSDGCDAFPVDSAEWFDLDGDTHGHNCDVNDFDNTVGCEEDSQENSNPSEPTTTTTTTSSGGSSGGGGGGGGGRLQLQYEWTCTDWSPCAPEGVQTRTCTQVTNYPGTWQKPAEEQSCEYTAPNSGSNGQPTPTNNGGNDNGGSLPVVLPVEADTVPPPITGAAVGLANPAGATVGVLLLVLILFLVWASWKYVKGKPVLGLGKYF